MRKHNKMTLQDRLTIKQMYYEGKSFREIGKAIGYSHTAVSNEIKRNGRMLQPSANNLRRTKGRVYHYNAYEAHKVANMRKVKTLINDIISISSLNKLLDKKLNTIIILIQRFILFIFNNHIVEIL